MPRPKFDRPEDHVTSSELAFGSGLTPRQFQKVQDDGLAPLPLPGGAKRGYNLWNARALEVAGIVNSFRIAGFPVVTAAKIARAIHDELSASYSGESLSNLGRYFRAPFNAGLALGTSDPTNVYWLHRQVFGTSFYQPRLPLDN